MLDLNIIYKMINKSIILVIIASFLSCSAKEDIKRNDKNEENIENIENIEFNTITEDKYSKWDETDNVDSPAFFTRNDTNYIVTTAKETDKLIFYNANTLEITHTFGKTGSKEGQFRRPNGIWVIDSLLLVVERDNHRVQVFNYNNMKTLGYVGYEKLKKPYGIAVFKSKKLYNILVTDDYESDDEKMPVDFSILDKRIQHYILDLSKGFKSDFIRYIGETKENSALKVVESIYADPINNKILIADESNYSKNIKIYSLDEGKFIKNIGDGLFKYQAEGIALYDCGNGKGYWFTTDQSEGNNTFHIFDRKTFDYITSFKSKVTQNTDGIWLTQTKTSTYPEGIFIPVNNDGGVSVYNLKELLTELNISCK